ncbi:MAG TPA: hypothetical protein PKE45_06020 [Caldilineaceae bacterium]|nr:hypothetical protein [Caldilineaceae bacterium]
MRFWPGPNSRFQNNRSLARCAGYGVTLFLHRLARLVDWVLPQGVLQ